MFLYISLSEYTPLSPLPSHVCMCVHMVHMHVWACIHVPVFTHAWGWGRGGHPCSVLPCHPLPYSHETASVIESDAQHIC